jgi:hypothetical protein
MVFGKFASILFNLKIGFFEDKVKERDLILTLAGIRKRTPRESLPQEKTEHGRSLRMIEM